MAKKIYLAEFDANENPYVRKLQSMDNMTKKYTTKIQGHYEKMNKMVSSIYSAAAITALTSFLGSAIKAYGEEEKAIKRVDTALGRANQTLTDYANQLQKTTTYADDQILTVMALISNYVKSETLIKKLTKATLSFATAKQIEVETAADLIAKTIAGSNALAKQRVEYDNTTKGVERVNSVLQGLSIFQGQAEAEAETYSGKLEQMTNQFANLQDAIAQGVIPTMAEFADLLSKIGKNVDNDGTGSLIDKWLKLAFIIPRTSLKGVAWLSDAMLGDPGKDWTGSVGYASDYGKNTVLGDNTTKTGKNIPRRITGGNTTRDAIASNIGASGILDDVSARGISRFSRDMQEVAVPELQASFDDISLSFVQRFGETQNIASNIANIFNVTANSFVGKLMQAFDVGSSILSIIGSIASLAGSPLGFLGLAEGGTVINKGGKLSYAPIPKFARGGSYMVPAGYSNDSGLIRVQSGERVDVTPSNQVPMLGKALGEIKQAIMAGNMNSARKGKQPVVVNVMLDGTDVTKKVIGNQNRLSKTGLNFNELN